jgi:prepilin-type N-terminal cleavage/methylation domain-containing protein
LPIRKNSAFSLLEIVIVVAIIGVLAAIGIPRLSRGTRGASNSALAGDLRVLRGAIDHYATDHGGRFPTLAGVEKQLTQYTNYGGGNQLVKGGAYIYGPYLRRVPPLPVGLRKGATGISDADGVDVGWIYDDKAGTIRANCGVTEVDARLKAFRDY